MEHYAAALTESIQCEIEAAQNAPFPESLDTRCQTLIKRECAKQRRKAFWKGTRKTLRYAAGVAITLLSLSSVLFMTVEAFRLPIINFFIEQNDGFWSITGQEKTSQIGEDFDPRSVNENDPLAGLIPEEYELIDARDNGDRGTVAIYQNSVGDNIRFSVLPYNASVQVDAEDAEFSEKKQILDHDGVFVIKDGTSQIAWVDQAAAKMYWIYSDVMTEAEIVTLAEEIAAQLLN